MSQNQASKPHKNENHTILVAASSSLLSFSPLVAGKRRKEGRERRQNLTYIEAPVRQA